MDLQWLLPSWAWLPLLLAAGAWVIWVQRVYARTVPAPMPAMRRLLVGLRTAAGLLVLLALARPLLVTERAVEEPAVVAVVVEDSGSMALQDRPDRPTRWRRALSLAAAADSLVQASGTGADLVLLRGNGRGDLVPTTLAEARQDTPTAVGSDLPTLVTQARQRLLARPLRGLVVLSDGHSDPGPTAGVADDAPLWLVGVGDPDGVADRSVSDLRYPDVVHVGETVLVDLVVRQPVTTSVDDSVTVRLRLGDEVVAERSGPAADLTRWELAWIPEEAGLAVLEVEVSALDNERFQANNRATLAVDVAEQQARLLMLAPRPGWDARFLAQAALAEPRLQLRVVRPGPAGPVFADSLTSWRSPRDAAAWRRDWDAVVLAGPPGELLPDGGRELAGAVRQGLGLFVLMADDGGTAQTTRWAPPLEELLPVQGVAGRPRPGEFSLQIAPDGRGHPILGDLGADASLATLPPLRLLLPTEARVGARTLLQAGERPVLVAGEPGRGRVAWFGARRLWELAFWQPAQGDLATGRPGERLARQLLLWSALGDQRGGLTWLGRQLVFEEGEPVPATIAWRDLRGDPLPGGEARVEVRAEGNASSERLHALRPDPARPGVYAALLPPLPPGRWELTPLGIADPPVQGAVRTVVVTDAARERAQVRQDRRYLRQAAARLGGTAIDGDRSGAREALLAELSGISLEVERTRRQSRLEPGASWGWLAVVVMLLGIEWTLRRRQGLL